MSRSIVSAVIAVIFVAFFSAAPVHADSVEYQFSSPLATFDYTSPSGFIGSPVSLTAGQAGCSASFGCSSVSFNPGFAGLTDELSVNNDPFFLPSFFELGAFSQFGKHFGLFDATLSVLPVDSVPEPSALLLLAAGLLGLSGLALKKALA